MPDLLGPMSVEVAGRWILGRKTADAITADLGLKWTIVAAMAVARGNDNPDAIKALREAQRNMHEKTTEPDCARCFNSGWIVIRAATLVYVGPGPLAEEAPGLTERRCKDCDRAWVHVYKFPTPGAQK